MTTLREVGLDVQGRHGNVKKIIIMDGKGNNVVEVPVSPVVYGNSRKQARTAFMPSQEVLAQLTGD